MSVIRRACSTRLQDLLEEEDRKEKKGKKSNGKKKTFTYAPDTGLVLQYVACVTSHSSSVRQPN